jgi:hypothetical protein
MRTRPVVNCLLRALGIITASSLLAGCIATARPVGPLQSYQRLGKIGGVPLEQVWIDPTFNIQDYRTLYVEVPRVDEFATAAHRERDHSAAQRLPRGFQRAAVREFQRLGIFDVVTDKPSFGGADRGVLVLRTKFVEVHTGWSWWRTFVGHGVGATRVELHGALIDVERGKTVMEFADRRVNHGAALLMGEDKASDPEFLIGIDLAGMVDGLAKLFIYMREEVPVRFQRS